MGLNTTLAPDDLISTLELKASHESKANPVTLQLWDPSKPALWVKLLPAKTDGLDSVVSGTHMGLGSSGSDSSGLHTCTVVHTLTEKKYVKRTKKIFNFIPLPLWS